MVVVEARCVATQQCTNNRKNTCTHTPPWNAYGTQAINPWDGQSTPTVRRTALQQPRSCNRPQQPVARVRNLMPCKTRRWRCGCAVLTAVVERRGGHGWWWYYATWGCCAAALGTSSSSNSGDNSSSQDNKIMPLEVQQHAHSAIKESVAAQDATHTTRQPVLPFLGPPTKSRPRLPNSAVATAKMCTAEPSEPSGCLGNFG